MTYLIFEPAAVEIAIQPKGRISGPILRLLNLLKRKCLRLCCCRTAAASFTAVARPRHRQSLELSRVGTLQQELKDMHRRFANMQRDLYDSQVRVAKLKDEISREREHRQYKKKARCIVLRYEWSLTFS